MGPRSTIIRSSAIARAGNTARAAALGAPPPPGMSRGPTTDAGGGVLSLLLILLLVAPHSHGQATCGDTNGAVAGVTAVTDTDCGTGFLYLSSQSAAECKGAVCNAGVDPDRAACCVAQAICRDKNGAAAGIIAVTDDDCGIGFNYAPSFGNNYCGGATCWTKTRDRAACCVAQATCGDKNGAAAGATAVTDADCGTGFVYQSSQSAAPCAGVECVPGTTDQATCCVAQATCGDKNGAAAGATAVTDADCGIGFKYTAALGSNLCAGSVCVAATTDQAACCVVRGAASAQLTDLTFKEASCKLLYSRISTL